MKDIGDALGGDFAGLRNLSSETARSDAGRVRGTGRSRAALPARAVTRNEEQVRARAAVTRLPDEEIQRQGGEIVGDRIRPGGLLPMDDLQITPAPVAGFGADRSVGPRDIPVGDAVGVAADGTGDPHDVPSGVGTVVLDRRLAGRDHARLNVRG